ncbi:Uncharacterized protein DIS24_g7631 [Lasiodiplodia hormozganensis]|uniref:K Homology domain-containing protein n=2 Tax=Lasiodiplodia TaxID=66739 RepID=A0A5N5DBU3_9PEZI|nr:KH domain protein [Lasiodiplodia theobromae]KAB2575117.1 Uncharacterized protein DBV05_g6221 [Lasiodiplodia theobromae]KAF4538894.1 KH domain protein [Lasiodiplodia theobromae]KAK0647620.1 Uncharacterized protein DIS24_g7631 [Lasiodiplodia hormozganensis]
MPEEGRKRSRFDQTEPEPKRQSRFDRRSRSPSSRQSEARRSRSPLSRQDSNSPATAERKDPAAAAAAAAAKINAQIQARKGIQHVDVPPIRSTASPATVKSPSAGPSGSGTSGEVYQQDGDYIKDIEVNDLRNRYTLTKGSTQKMIKEETGADVTTRGEYYPDKSLARPGAPPLYLHVTSTTKEGLEKAVAKIDELMKQELPNLVDERRFRRREPEQVERDEYGRRKWPEEKIPVDLEPIPGFNLRAQVVGHGGAYVKHIQQETRCRVQIKGRGSGFIEHNTGQESDEPMYLHVAGPNADDVQKAKELCEDLLANVRQQYEQFKERGPSRRGYGDGDRYSGGGRNGGRSDSYGGGYGGNSSYGGGSSYGNQQSPGYGSAMSPTSQTTPATPATAASDPYAAYAQYYAAGGDPYAAYGGYQNYVNMYYQYAQQQQQQQGAPPGSEAPPPPPGSAPPPPPGDAPPPPPPSGSPPGGYSAVPPPPGL